MKLDYIFHYRRAMWRSDRGKKNGSIILSKNSQDPKIYLVRQRNVPSWSIQTQTIRTSQPRPVNCRKQQPLKAGLNCRLSLAAPHTYRGKYFSSSYSYASSPTWSPFLFHFFSQTPLPHSSLSSQVQVPRGCCERFD